MQILQLTLHPPHAVHNKKIVSSPTFPFCFYGSEGRLGQEHYCNAFQTTFNEYGLCYTFNNAHQGLQEYFSNETFWQRKGNFNLTKDFFSQYFFSFSLFIFPLFDFTWFFFEVFFIIFFLFPISFPDFFPYFFPYLFPFLLLVKYFPFFFFFFNDKYYQFYISFQKVTGCGKNRGFQLVLDAQRIQSLLPKNHLTRGFKVFVTIPGVITSKVPFWADPTFRGEHNFYIHGIHVIKVI